jgi:hypothetical protein
MPKTNRRRTTHRKRTSQRKRKNAKKTAIEQRGGTTFVYYRVNPYKSDTKRGPTTIHLSTEDDYPETEDKIKLFYSWLGQMSEMEGDIKSNADFLYNYFYTGEEYGLEYDIDKKQINTGSIADPIIVKIFKIYKTDIIRNYNEMNTEMNTEK